MPHSWYEKWFNADYLKLYAHRDAQEAYQQVSFLIDRLHIVDKARILDIGCGAGRHSLEFAMRGFDVTGVDLSETLIDIARKSAAENKKALSLKFLRANFFQLQIFDLFDVALSMFSSFGYLDSDKENGELFTVAYRHLVQGGLFFLDYLNPATVRETLKPYEVIAIEDKPWEIYKKIENNTIIKRIVLPTVTYEERLKLYTKEQIVDMLEQRGLQVISLWSNYAGEVWRPDGERQLFLCRK